MSKYTLVAQKDTDSPYQVVGQADDFDESVALRATLLDSHRDALIYLTRHFSAATLALLNVSGDNGKLDWESINKTREVEPDGLYSKFDADAADLLAHYERIGLEPGKEYPLPIEEMEKTK